MATIHPLGGPGYPCPGTPGGSSQMSIPSNSVTVHDHVLPPGWSCKFDPRTNKYYFIHDHGAPGPPWSDYLRSQYGQSSSVHSSRSSSPSHHSRFQQFSSRYKSAYDPQVQRIAKMFPEADEHHISQLLRIYHNKENSVISALLAEVHAKAALVQQSQAVHADDALFYKLRNYFPTTDSDTIRRLQTRYNNEEHEIIAALVAGLNPEGSRIQTTSVIGSPKMKLRYLKLMYPDADEAILFDLLYNCEHNAQLAIERLEKMGYKRQDMIRPSSAKVESLSIEPTLRALRPQTAPVKPLFPPNVAEKQKIFQKLAEHFPAADRTLINMALECGGYVEERARLFLSAMTPQDHEKYTQRAWGRETSPLPFRACRGTQTGALIETISGTPILGRRSGQRPDKHQSTWTWEDGVIEKPKKKPLAKGPNQSNRKGPKILTIIKSYLPTWKGADPKNRSGPDPSNRRGPSTEIGASKIGFSSLAKGPDSKNRKGANRMLMLLRRIKDEPDDQYGVY